MPENPTFVVNDRRKFTSDGELRHDLPAEPPQQRSEPDVAKGPQLTTTPDDAAQTTAKLADFPESNAVGNLSAEENTVASAKAEPWLPDQPDIEGEDEGAFMDDASVPPGPTPEQAAEAARAYHATADRLDTAMRAANPGGDRIPPMTFDRLVQSLYTQALILLGGGAQPGETPRVDILGARDTIDMLTVLEDKSRNNLSDAEDKLLQSALFDLRMGFLEITQALARQAAQRQPMPGAPGGISPLNPAGPRIVR